MGDGGVHKASSGDQLGWMKMKYRILFMKMIANEVRHDKEKDTVRVLVLVG